MGRLMLNDKCYTGSDNLLILNDESYSGGRIVKTVTRFRYLKWHITDNGNNNNVLQIAEVEFRDENGVAFTMPTGFTATSSMPPYVPEEDVYVLFDGTDKKLVILPWVSGTSVEDITIDLGEGNYLDIMEYPYFCWKSGNDDSQYFGRPPRVWQLYGANQSDFSDAVLLDDTTVPINSQNLVWAYRSRMALNVKVNEGVDYPESWIITNDSTTMSVHTEYIDGVVSSYAVYSQPGNQSRVEGDLTIFIGESSGWLWNVTATADMTYRIYDMINGTLGDLLTATSGTVIMSGIPITGDYTYEIRRYS